MTSLKRHTVSRWCIASLFVRLLVTPPYVYVGDDVTSLLEPPRTRVGPERFHDDRFLDTG